MQQKGENNKRPKRKQPGRSLGNWRINIQISPYIEETVFHQAEDDNFCYLKQCSISNPKDTGRDIEIPQGTVRTV